MRTIIYVAAICATLVAVYGAPAPNPEPSPAANPNPDPAAAADDKPEIIEIIAPAASAQVRVSSYKSVDLAVIEDM